MSHAKMGEKVKNALTHPTNKRKMGENNENRLYHPK